MQPSWYTVCLPARLFFAVGAYLAWFSYIYIVVAVGMVASFVMERKPVKLVHAACWGVAYFGGIPAFIALAIDIGISVVQFGHRPWAGSAGSAGSVVQDTPAVAEVTDTTETPPAI